MHVSHHAVLAGYGNLRLGQYLSRPLVPRIQYRIAVIIEFGIAAQVFGGKGVGEIIVDPKVVKVSIVGLGMRSHAGVAAKMFRILADAGINIEAISTSEIKVSCLIAAGHEDEAVRELHDGFGLGDRPG